MLKIRKLKLINELGVKSGLGLNELEIELPDDKSIFIFRGRNGVGKSNIMKSIHPFSETGVGFIPNEIGKKEIDLINERMDEYHITHIYTPNKTGNHSVKSFITVNGEELNETGQVKSFAEIIKKEFGLTKDILKTQSISSDVNIFKDYSASERGKFLSKFIEELDDILRLDKVIRDKAREVNSVEKHISHTLKSIGDENDLSIKIKEYESNINSLDNIIVKNKSEIVLFKNELKEIESTDVGEIIDNLDKIKKSYIDIISKYNKDNKNKIENWLKNDTACNLLSNTRNQIKNKSVEKELLSKDIKNKEEQINQIENKINQNKSFLLSQDKDMCDKFINDFEAIELQIKEIVDGYEFIDINHINVIETVINNIRFIKNNGGFIKDTFIDYVSVKDYSEKSIEEAIKHLDEKEKVVDFKINLKQVFLKHESTSIGHCEKMGNNICPYFIPENYDNLINEKSDITEQKNKFKSIHEIKDNFIYSMNVIKNEINFVQSIDNKLVSFYNNFVKSIFSDNYKETIELINKNSDIITTDFIEISEIIQSLKDSLFKRNEMKIQYDKNVDFINQYEVKEKENIQLEEKLKDINVADSIKQLREIDNDIEYLEKFVLDLDIDHEEIDEIVYEKKELNKQIESHKDDLDKVKQLNNKIHNIELDIEKHESDKEIIIRNLDNVKFKLNQIKEMKSQLKDIEGKSHKINLIKKALSPSSGIALLFIDKYLERVRVIANRLLKSNSDSVGLEFDKFVINDGEFRLPFLKSVNGFSMVNDDIRNGSQGERSMLSTSLSFAFSQIFKSEYNIIYLDEIDGALDDVNKIIFGKMIEQQSRILEIQQVFIVSHNELFNESDDACFINLDIMSGNVNFS